MNITSTEVFHVLKAQGLAKNISDPIVAETLKKIKESKNKKVQKATSRISTLTSGGEDYYSDLEDILFWLLIIPDMNIHVFNDNFIDEGSFAPEMSVEAETNRYVAPSYSDVGSDHSDSGSSYDSSDSGSCDSGGCDCGGGGGD